jgi:hypothetical protein
MLQVQTRDIHESVQYKYCNSCVRLFIIPLSRWNCVLFKPSYVHTYVALRCLHCTYIRVTLLKWMWFRLRFDERCIRKLPLFRARVARVSRAQNTKTRKNTLNDQKDTKWLMYLMYTKQLQSLLNGREIYHNFFVPRPSKMYQIWNPSIKCLSNMCIPTMCICMHVEVEQLRPVSLLGTCPGRKFHTWGCT